MPRASKPSPPWPCASTPNVDAHTHAKITTGTYENKFGIQLEQVEDVYARAAKLKHLRLRGIQMHIGSQLTETGPFEQAVKKVLPLVQRLAARHGFEFFSIGGGIGIVYEDALDSGSEAWWKTKAASGILTPDSYARKLIPLLQPLGLKILVEPGRFIAGNSGILVTRVEYIKKTAKKNFVLVDAAMTDLLRPAFYNSYHQIVPVRQQRGPAISSDVAGGICESSDFFCKDRKLSKVAEGDYLALLSAGAYGFTMASNYNTRPLAAEVIVNGKQSFFGPQAPASRIHLVAGKRARLETARALSPKSENCQLFENSAVLRRAIFLARARAGAILHADSRLPAKY